MKILQTFARSTGKLILASGLVVIAAGAGFAGTAALVYTGVGTSGLAKSAAAAPVAAHRFREPAIAKTATTNGGDYIYISNIGSQAHSPRSHVAVPAPLETPAEEIVAPDETTPTPVVVPVAIPTEVRVASAVTHDGMPIVNGIPVAVATSASDSQFVPVRKALPVNAPRSFNVAEELASDDSRPVLRAIPVNTTAPARSANPFRAFGN